MVNQYHIMSVERLSLSTTAVSNTPVATIPRTVLVASDTAHYIKTGSVTATLTNSSYFPAGIPYLLSLAAGETVSAILAAGTGTMTVSTVKLTG